MKFYPSFIDIHKHRHIHTYFIEKKMHSYEFKCNNKTVSNNRIIMRNKG